MSVIHFLNVKQGDCSWIQHNTEHITVIDVYNASKVLAKKEAQLETFSLRDSVRGNYNQKEHPVNPIEYMQAFNVNGIFRFIITHPDMDHLGGIEDLFGTFDITNVWDTNNKKEISDFSNGPYSERDWEFYKQLRDGRYSGSKRLALYSGSTGKYYNRDDDDKPGGDGLSILAPTKDLLEAAIESGDYNDASYVILYRSNNRKVVFGGDSADKTWQHILENHKDSVTDVDVLIAPHHGRDSNESYEYLDVLKPKITYVGNAKSQHLAYDKWKNRGLTYITNNQANCIITEILDGSVKVYVTYEKFARAINSGTTYSPQHKAWYIGSV